MGGDEEVSDLCVLHFFILFFLTQLSFSVCEQKRESRYLNRNVNFAPAKKGT